MNYLKKRFSVAPGSSKAYRDNFDAAFGHQAPDEDGPPAPDEVVDPDLERTPLERPPMPPRPAPTPMPPADDD